MFDQFDGWHIGLVMWSMWSTSMWYHWQKRAEKYRDIIIIERRETDQP
jgi:hypothetical protein